MHAPTAYEPYSSEAPEISADDLAFISQFAEATENPALESASASCHSGGAGLGRSIAPLPKDPLTPSGAKSSDPVGDEDVDSEDEVEGFLTGAPVPAKASSKAIHVAK